MAKKFIIITKYKDEADIVSGQGVPHDFTGLGYYTDNLSEIHMFVDGALKLKLDGNALNLLDATFQNNGSPISGGGGVTEFKDLENLNDQLLDAQDVYLHSDGTLEGDVGTTSGSVSFGANYAGLSASSEDGEGNGASAEISVQTFNDGGVLSAQLLLSGKIAFSSVQYNVGNPNPPVGSISSRNEVYGLDAETNLEVDANNCSEIFFIYMAPDSGDQTLMGINGTDINGESSVVLPQGTGWQCVRGINKIYLISLDPTP